MSLDAGAGAAEPPPQDLAAPVGASQASISHHYDVGNDFYSLWLDDSLTYSAALWRDEEQSLADAQRNKLDWHLDEVDIQRASRLLDVGCGWGSLLRRAAERNAGLTGIGLSLAAEQVRHVTQLRVPRLEARLQNWQDHMAEAPYDAIVSIGAFEHFCRLDQSAAEKLEGYRRFFRFCRDNLRPTGALSLQTITYETADRSQFSKFFAEQIFPESDLPHLGEIVEASRGFFEVKALRNDRHHYARTLRQWLSRLRARREEAVALVGADTVQRYDRYLGMMIIAFHTGATNLCRISFRPLAPAKRALG